MKARRLTAAAMGAALVFVVTWFVKIPIPVSGGAYLNFGDAVICVLGYVLGGPLGAIAAGIGSTLADLAGGSALYAVPTFLIKAGMGLIVGAMTASQRFLPYCFACILSGAVMVAGYAVFEWGFFGSMYATATLPFNVIQWCGGVPVALVLFRGAKRLSVICGFRNVGAAVAEPVRR